MLLVFEVLHHLNGLGNSGLVDPSSDPQEAPGLADYATVIVFGTCLLISGSRVRNLSS